MRLGILDSGHTLASKALFLFIQVVSRLPVPDVVKALQYRPDFFGEPMRRVLQTAMRGPSDWAVAEREMMAAFVSSVNNCEY